MERGTIQFNTPTVLKADASLNLLLSFELQLVRVPNTLVDRKIFADIGCNCLAAFGELNQLGARGCVVRKFGELPEVLRLTIQISDPSLHGGDVVHANRAAKCS